MTPLRVQLLFNWSFPWNCSLCWFTCSRLLEGNISKDFLSSNQYTVSDTSTQQCTHIFRRWNFDSLCSFALLCSKVTHPIGSIVCCHSWRISFSLYEKIHLKDTPTWFKIHQNTITPKVTHLFPDLFWVISFLCNTESCCQGRLRLWLGSGQNHPKPSSGENHPTM